MLSRAGPAKDTLYGFGGDDTLDGGDGGDQLQGGVGDDTLTGGAGNDRLFGNVGNDTLDGGPGNDTLTGGAGSDQFRFHAGFGSDAIADYTLGASKAASEKIYLCMGTQTNQPGHSGMNSGSNHVITVTFNGATNKITLTGINTDHDNLNIVIPASMGETCTVIRGTANNDILMGTPQRDTMYGLDGNDELYGLGADDILNGGPGADLLDGGEGTDTASYAGSAAGVNVDLNSTGRGGDALGDTLTRIENITGSDQNDILRGDGNNNRLSGGRGNDVLVGRAGDDELQGGIGTDKFQFYGTFGADTIEDYTLGASKDASEGIYLCMGTETNLPTHSGVDSGGNRVITVTFNSATAGTITLKGVTSGSTNFGNLNIVIPASSGELCSLAPAP